MTTIEQWWEEDAERLNKLAEAARPFAAKVLPDDDKPTDAKAWCPTGPGGGRDNSCSPKRNAVGDVSVPTEDEARANYEALYERARKQEAQREVVASQWSSMRFELEKDRLELEKLRNVYPRTPELEERINAAAEALDDKELTYAQLSRQVQTMDREEQLVLHEMTREKMQLQAANPEEYRAAMLEDLEGMKATHGKLAELEKLADESGYVGLYNSQIGKMAEVVRSFATLEDALETHPALQSHPELAKAMFEYKGPANMRPDNSKWLPPYYGDPHTVGDTRAEMSSSKVSKLVAGRVKEQGGASEDVKSFTEQCGIYAQMSSGGVAQILMSEDGRVKNGFFRDTPGSVGDGRPTYWPIRKGAEKRMFDIPLSARPDQRPVYGYLEHPHRSRSVSQKHKQYGDVQVVFKPAVKARTTMTVGDSLDDEGLHGAKAVAVNDPGGSILSDGYTVSAAPVASDWKVGYASDPEAEGWTPRYIEAQMHGKVSRGDIQEIRAAKGTLSSYAREAAAKHGIPIVDLPPPHILYSYARGW